MQQTAKQTRIFKVPTYYNKNNAIRITYICKYREEYLTATTFNLSAHHLQLLTTIITRTA